MNSNIFADVCQIWNVQHVLLFQIKKNICRLLPMQLIKLMRKRLMPNWREKMWCTRNKLKGAKWVLQLHISDTLDRLTTLHTAMCSGNFMRMTHHNFLWSFLTHYIKGITNKVANFDCKVCTPHSAVLSVHMKCILQLLPFWMYDLMHFTFAVQV